jgi:hypothetical protein
MAVVSVITASVKPGRFEDYLEESARKGKALAEKYGAKNVRLLTAVAGGGAAGTVVFISEFGNFGEYGVFTDKSLADPEVIALMQVTEDGPVAAWQSALWVDVPL